MENKKELAWVREEIEELKRQQQENHKEIKELVQELQKEIIQQKGQISKKNESKKEPTWTWEEIKELKRQQQEKIKALKQEHNEEIKEIKGQSKGQSQEQLLEQYQKKQKELQKKVAYQTTQVNKKREEISKLNLQVKNLKESNSDVLKRLREVNIEADLLEKANKKIDLLERKLEEQGKELYAYQELSKMNPKEVKKVYKAITGKELKE